MVSSDENVSCKVIENLCLVSLDQEINNEVPNQVLLEENVCIENCHSKEYQEGMEDAQMPEEKPLINDIVGGLVVGDGVLQGSYSDQELVMVDDNLEKRGGF